MTCTTDNECPGDEICEAGACTLPAAARGCVADTECKGERICVEGRCQAPTTVVQPTQPGQPAQPVAPAEPLTRGWAKGGGATALALTIPALGLAIGSDVTREDQVPSLPLGAVATVLVATAVPIAFSGAQSARKGAKVSGGTGLIITSWVFYGLTMANAIGLIGMGVSEITPPPGVISLTGVLGLTSGTTMAVAAFVADKQASEKIQAQAATARLSFGMSPLRHGSRTVGATFGIAAQF